MEEPIAYLQQRVHDDWLIGYETNQFNCLIEQFIQQLTHFSQEKTPPTILLAEQNPQKFLAAFLAAVTTKCPIFLCNPNWVQKEWQHVFECVQPDLIFGQVANFPIPHFPFPIPHSPSPNHIMIPTGGSSGKIRFAIHTWETLMASVRGFHQYFGLNPVNSFCVLPLYHVSGLMQFLRSFTTDGRLIIKSFKQLAADEGLERNQGVRSRESEGDYNPILNSDSCILNSSLQIDPAEFFISLVPTQLQRCLQNPELTSWLSQFKTVLLGGAPAWESLLEQARQNNIRLAPTYGMTETASQIVTLKPEDFLAGNNSCGQVLPHANVTIHSSTGEQLGTNQIGIITIQADSLTLGYYGDGRKGERETFQLLSQNLESDDLGFFDEQGYLHIVGRSSRKIITGGENVFPTEVEAAIQATQLVSDVGVIGIPDLHWGQAVTAVYVPHSATTCTVFLKTALKDKLSKYKQPKHWVPVERLPRNAQGKVNYEQLQKIVTQWLEHQESSLGQLG